jgi:hypothetical protein
MPLLELTTTFRGISTSPKSRTGLAPKAAADRAKANLRYITREDAGPGFLVADGAGVRRGGHDDLDAFREALSERAEGGGKRGVRVAERMTVSLPAGWPGGAWREAVERIAKVVAPAGSEAQAVIALHTDKPKNPHIHLLAIDGLESPAVARARTPEGQRPRRRNAVRMGDMGRPRELRQAIAEAINQVAAERGLSGVEWRSFEDRGLSQKPTKHRGPPKPRKGRDRGDEAPEPVAAPTTPQEPPEAATQPIPQPATASPPAPTPEPRRMFVRGRWVAMPAKGDSPKKRRDRDRARDDDQR